MKTKVQAALVAAFVADALALPAHWIYDTGRLAKEFGRLDQFVKPAKGSYHFGKDKGDFTHYGDQMRVLLESVVACNGFELEDFARRWRALFADYQGYVDEATQATLENFARGASPANAGSPSNNLAGASRMVPLVLCYHQDLEGLVRAARQQTQMTHNNSEVIESAEFFARVLWRVLHGGSSLAAVDEVTACLPATTPLAGWVATGKQLAVMDSVTAIGSLGQSCHASHAFPSVIQLLARHEDNLAEALIDGIMAGGDSAARGILVGAVMAAHHGWDAIPTSWVTDIKSHQHLLALVSRLKS
jgi:ADP-ribosylglycohydrolase